MSTLFMRILFYSITQPKRMPAKYCLQDKLGSGGYSSVYRCVDNIGIRYACKILRKEQNKRERVRREVEMLYSLRHSTRVARFIDAREDADNYYIIQEWCKGGMLREYVRKHDTYAENTVASIVRGVLRGLHHIHESGIIHRDIKGPNVMFADETPDAEIRIIDFGAAMYYDSSATDLVPSEDLVGTPWFMAPEALGHKFSPKSDIWSLGVLTYQLLSGKMPFNDVENPYRPSIIRLFKSIYTDPPMMEGSDWENISAEAKEFIQCCLKKQHEARPTAEQALKHVWLTSTDCVDRFTGKALLSSPFDHELINSMINAATHDV